MNGKQKQKINDRKGQSTLEYILMLTIVIVILLMFLGQKGFFQKSYNKIIRQQGEDIYEMTNSVFF